MSMKFLILLMGVSCLMLADGNAKQNPCYDKFSGAFRGLTPSLNGKNGDQITKLCNSDPLLKLKCGGNCTYLAPPKKKSGFF